MTQESMLELTKELTKDAPKIVVYKDALSFTGWSLKTSDDGSGLPASPYEVALYLRARLAELKLAQLLEQMEKK